MKTVTFTEFRNHASSLLDGVERGEVVRILRHGKPIAEVLPVSDESSRTPSWKRASLRLVVKGTALSKAILDERRPA